VTDTEAGFAPAAPPWSPRSPALRVAPRLFSLPLGLDPYVELVLESRDATTLVDHLARAPARKPEAEDRDEREDDDERKENPHRYGRGPGMLKRKFPPDGR
jgi:hypothetical protein